MVTQTRLITQISSDSLGTVNFVPQAVLRRSVGYFADLGYRFETGTDDLDEYECAFFEMEDGVRFGLIRYRGNPGDCTTLYFDADERNVKALVGRILSAFDMPPAAVEWSERIP